MEPNGIGNSVNPQNVNNVVDQANNTANDVISAAQQAQGAQTAMGNLFFALIQKIMSEAQSNGSSGA